MANGLLFGCLAVPSSRGPGAQSRQRQGMGPGQGECLEEDHCVLCYFCPVMGLQQHRRNEAWLVV